MQQHPVPQPITSYEFRLVGDMTIRQFSKVAAGVVLALIVYGIDPPIALLKWFLIVLFAGTGFLMAFVPFQGRSIDNWIVSFIKRIYLPTLYTWKKGTSPAVSTSPVPIKTPSGEIITPAMEKLQRGSQKINIATGAIKSSPSTSAQQTTSVTGQQTPQQKIPQPQTKPGSTPLSTPTVASVSVKKGIYPTKIVPPQIPKYTPVEAKFNPDIFIPATPSIPNIIVGYTRNKEGKLIENAILEIRNSFGTPVRALKTNKLGQFQIATPLSNGTYEIEIEKEGFSFDIIKINLEGKITPPIEILSKN